MKVKYFAYRKEIKVEGEKTRYAYVLRPSILTLLRGEFSLNNFNDYTPRTSFDSLAKLERKVDELRSGKLRAEVVDNRLSLFTQKEYTETYEGKEQTIEVLPMRDVEEGQTPSLNVRIKGIVGGVKTWI